MSNASNTLEELIGGHLLRTATWSKPAAIYVALMTTMPAEDGTGGVEVSGGNYARVQHGPGDAYWTAPVAGDGIHKNIGAITYASPNANWGNVIGVCLYDASTGGTLLASKTLAAARNIIAGDPAPNFPDGTLQVVIG